MATKQELQALHGKMTKIVNEIQEVMEAGILGNDWMEMADDAKGTMKEIINEVDLWINDLEKGEQK